MATYPGTIGGVDPTSLDRWSMAGALPQSSKVQTFLGAPGAGTRAVETPSAAPVAPGVGYYSPPAQAPGTPPLAPGNYGAGAGTTFTAPSGIVYTYRDGNWVPDQASVQAWLSNYVKSNGGAPPSKMSEAFGAATANDQMHLERAREDWQGQQLQGVRSSPETQARAGQLQEQGRRDIYGRAYSTAGNYGEQMSRRGLGESPMAGMVQGDIMQSAAEGKADADLAALNQAIAEGQQLIFGGEALRKPGIAAMLQDALDARMFERRAALQRDMAGSDWMKMLGSVAGIGASYALPRGGGAGGGGGVDLGGEWDPNRVPVEW